MLPDPTCPLFVVFVGVTGLQSAFFEFQGKQAAFGDVSVEFGHHFRCRGGMRRGREF